MNYQYGDDEENLLDDSTYDLLSDSVLTPSDDEDDDTSSLASLDEASDELASISGAESIGDSEDSASHDFERAEQVSEVEQEEATGIPAFTGLDHHDELHGSSLTVLDDIALPDVLRADENGSIIDGPTSILLHEYSKSDIQEINNRDLKMDPVPTEITAYLQMSMTKNSLSLDEPFKVLYVGGDTFERDDVVRKLGAALAAEWTSGTDQKSVKYSVVPVSSFGSSHPEVELVESCCVEMIIDTCVEATSFKSSVHEDRLGEELITLRLEPDIVIKSATGQIKPQHWTLPHLVVIYNSDDDDKKSKDTISNIRTFVKQHGLGCLEISRTFPLRMNIPISTLETVTIQLKGNTSTEQDSKQMQNLQTYPIDVQTFLRLDVGQLNRVMNYIVQTHPQQARSEVFASETVEVATPTEVSETTIKKKNIDLISDRERDAILESDRRRKDDLWSKFLVILAICAGVLAATHTMLGYKALSMQDMAHVSTAKVAQVPSISILTKSSISTVTQIVTSTVSAPSAMKSKISSALAIKPGSSLTSKNSQDIPTSKRKIKKPTSLSTPIKTDLASIGGDKKKQEPINWNPNTRQDFVFHVIGSAHIIIKPPQKFASLKYPPQLNVDINRHDRQVKGRLSKIFQGVYSLAIEDGQGWGTMNVTIYTTQKPKISITREVDFGSPWWKGMTLKRAWELCNTGRCPTMGSGLENIPIAGTPYKFKDIAEATSRIMCSLGKASNNVNRKVEDLKTSTGTEYRIAKDQMKEALLEISQKTSELVKKTKSKYSIAAARSRKDVNDKLKIAQKQAVKYWAKKPAVGQKIIRKAAIKAITVREEIKHKVKQQKIKRKACSRVKGGGMLSYLRR